MNFIFPPKQALITTLVYSLMGLFLTTNIVAGDTKVPSTELHSNESATAPRLALHELANDSKSELPVPTNGKAQRVITHHLYGRTEHVVVQPEDEIWLVSARESHDAPSDLSLLQCSQLVNGTWQTAPLEGLVESHSADKSRVTMLYVHGDRTSYKFAKSRGLQFYQTTCQTAKRPPVRFVIFAWRSERERARMLLDYQTKSQRAVVIGETLATLLCQFDDRQMVVGGFSLGAQVVLTAMSQPELQSQQNQHGKYRLAIFAHVLNPEFMQTKLMSFPDNPIVQQTDVFLNQGDRAVKLSQLVDRKRTEEWQRTEAFVTLRKLASMSPMGNKREQRNPSNRIIVRDITSEVRKKHSIGSYGLSAMLNNQLAESLNATFEARLDKPKLPYSNAGRSENPIR